MTIVVVVVVVKCCVKFGRGIMNIVIILVSEIIVDEIKLHLIRR